MKDERLGTKRRQLFIPPHYFVTALYIQCARSLCQELGVADDDRLTHGGTLGFGNCFQHYLRTDAGRITHRNPHPRSGSYRLRSFVLASFHLMTVVAVTPPPEKRSDFRDVRVIVVDARHLRL